jgi:hypothetical protein
LCGEAEGRWYSVQAELSAQTCQRAERVSKQMVLTEMEVCSLLIIVFQGGTTECEAA